MFWYWHGKSVLHNSLARLKPSASPLSAQIILALALLAVTASCAKESPDATPNGVLSDPLFALPHNTPQRGDGFSNRKGAQTVNAAWRATHGISAGDSLSGQEYAIHNARLQRLVDSDAEPVVRHAAARQLLLCEFAADRIGPNTLNTRLLQLEQTPSAPPREIALTRLIRASYLMRDGELETGLSLFLELIPEDTPTYGFGTAVAAKALIDSTAVPSNSKTSSAFQPDPIRTKRVFTILSNELVPRLERHLKAEGALYFQTVQNATYAYNVILSDSRKKILHSSAAHTYRDTVAEVLQDTLDSMENYLIPVMGQHKTTLELLAPTKQRIARWRNQTLPSIRNQQLPTEPTV